MTAKIYDSIKVEIPDGMRLRDFEKMTTFLTDSKALIKILEWKYA